VDKVHLKKAYFKKLILEILILKNVIQKVKNRYILFLKNYLKNYQKKCAKNYQNFTQKISKR
jgi:hypothetical protein